MGTGGINQKENKRQSIDQRDNFLVGLNRLVNMILFGASTVNSKSSLYVSRKDLFSKLAEVISTQDRNSKEDN